MSAENLLIVASSESNADMLYATGLFVPDPFIYFCVKGRRYIVLSDLEIDRGRREARDCTVISLARCQDELRRQGVKRPGLAEVAARLLKRKGVRKVLAPDNFPLLLAKRLNEHDMKVEPVDGSFFPQRETKARNEVAKIRAALRIAEAGMQAGMAALKRSKITRGAGLIYRGARLTSERLRAVIDTAVTQAGGLAAHTIVAGGLQGCDPHERGHGPLRAHVPIIIDIFPRAQKTGFFGDITRTVVRGRATEGARGIYQAVFEGQKIAFQKMRAGAPTASIHAAVRELFQSRGYQTGVRNGRMEGFFHGTGHGLGLEIHEAPRVGATSSGKLKAGNVVTVEPGLYYPGVGAVRLEDVALITASNPRNLTRFPKYFEV